MVKESPSLFPPTLEPQYSPFPPHRGNYDRFTCPATTSLYSRMQKSKRVNVRSMVAPSPGLSRVMEPLGSWRALPLTRWWDLKAEVFLLRWLILLRKVYFGSVNCTWHPSLPSTPSLACRVTGYFFSLSLFLTSPFSHPRSLLVSTMSDLLKCLFVHGISEAQRPNPGQQKAHGMREMGGVESHLFRSFTHTYIFLSESFNNLAKEVFLPSPFCWLGNWGLDRIYNLPKVKRY